MKHPHAWKWDRKGGRNLCYKHNQQNRVHEHPCKETSCSLEYQTMEKVQKPSNSMCYAPSSEPFRTNFIPVFPFGFSCGISWNKLPTHISFFVSAHSFITLTLSSTLDNFFFFATSAFSICFQCLFVAEGTFSIYFLRVLRSWNTKGYLVLFKKGHWHRWQEKSHWIFRYPCKEIEWEQGVRCHYKWIGYFICLSNGGRKECVLWRFN
jgi:hypothetical protein